MNICTYNKKCKERRQQEMGMIIGAFLGIVLLLSSMILVWISERKQYGLWLQVKVR